MYKPLSSRQFQLALYLQMIYTDYLDILASYFHEKELEFSAVYDLLEQEEVKNLKQLSKPPFSVMVQALLNVMMIKGLFSQQQAPVIFLTEENVKQFIQDAQNNHPDKKLKIDELLRATLDSPELISLAEENLAMF